MLRNGYFIISTGKDGSYVTTFPPAEGGRPVGVEDIISFLDEKKFTQYQAVDLAKGLHDLQEDASFKISDVAMDSSAAFCAYNIAPDNMSMTAVLYPPVGTGTEMTVSELMRDLEVKGVVYGIAVDTIRQVITEKIYNTPFTVAEGTEPVQGSDARIEYLFNTEHAAKPKMNDDGTVDYHELDLISRIEAEQPVARMIPEDRGTPGSNIFGAELPPNRVSKINFKYGKNLYISEDGLSLITKVSGHAVLEGDKVFVSDTYEVPVDLDNTTGDIDYDGNVLVRGNVRAGFSLKATGDITVIGVVEGAYVNAGGDVTINRGVQGMNKAEIRAGGNIVAKFIENATVVCKGNLETDSILHSSISAGGGVTVQGRNGLIVGGTVRSARNVVAKQIGNEMGTATNVYVGVDPMLRRRVNELSEIIKKSNIDKEKLNQVITSLRRKMEVDGKLDSAKQEMLQKSMKNIILLEQSIKKDTAEYTEGQRQLVEDVDVRIKISRSIYSGVKLSFGNTVYQIKDRNDYCQYAKQGADVVRLPL